MPVIVWIIIAVIAAGATTAVVVPAVIGNDDPEVKTAPAEPGIKTTPIKTAPVISEPVTTTLEEEPLPERLPFADEPLLPLGKAKTEPGSGGMTNKLPF
jgi:hypothetical protein